MKNFDWSRFQNYGLWISIFALIPLILHAVGIEVVPEEYQNIVNALLGILVGLGLISNPTTASKWYLDDQNKESKENKLE